ncbi:hypothetical protein V6N11_071262 [Hibiscus sabdariffa]|uniref:Uncharacterized protein n=1 Tax=Hibiscus sabdariffa TaxID=183260 RepID=A0ABR2U040_9ROSI
MLPCCSLDAKYIPIHLHLPLSLSPRCSCMPSSRFLFLDQFCVSGKVVDFLGGASIYRGIINMVGGKQELEELQAIKISILAHLRPKRSYKFRHETYKASRTEIFPSEDRATNPRTPTRTEITARYHHQARPIRLPVQCFRIQSSVSPSMLRQPSNNGSGFQSPSRYSLTYGGNVEEQQQQQENVVCTNSLPFATPIGNNDDDENTSSGYGNWSIAQSFHFTYQTANPSLSVFQKPIFGME